MTFRTNKVRWLMCRLCRLRKSRAITDQISSYLTTKPLLFYTRLTTNSLKKRLDLETSMCTPDKTLESPQSTATHLKSQWEILLEKFRFCQKMDSSLSQISVISIRKWLVCNSRTQTNFIALMEKIWLFGISKSSILCAASITCRQKSTTRPDFRLCLHLVWILTSGNSSRQLKSLNEKRLACQLSLILLQSLKLRIYYLLVPQMGRLLSITWVHNL